ncbi:MAG: hypothetical protein R6V03_05740 [Kiritimatiellia bacterium]
MASPGSWHQNNGNTLEVRGALDISAQSFHLLRIAPLQVIAPYFVGTIPFVLGLLYFWADMSTSAFAWRRCLAASFGVAVLFVWMKSWHTVFAGRLDCFITGSPTGTWTLRRVLRMTAVQTAIQAWSLLVIPAAILLVLPFPAVHAFYHNVMIEGDGTDSDLKSVAGKSWKNAKLWPRQNAILMWLFAPWILGTGMAVVFTTARAAVSFSPGVQPLDTVVWFVAGTALMYYLIFPLSPFGCSVAANIALFLVIFPHLLRVLFGVETWFTLSGWSGIFNTTFLTSVFCLSFLCLDPVMKTAYVLRRFYAASRRTGQDILADLAAADERS